MINRRSEISLMLLAICQQRKGNLPEGVRLVNQVILDAPDRADLHLHLASIFQNMGWAKEAASHVQRARLLSAKVPQPQ